VIEVRGKKKTLDLMIAGVGGQGNVSASRIVGTALIEAGYKVSIGETFGMSQRGGAVVSHIRASKELPPPPLIPPMGADIVVGLEPMETLRTVLHYLTPGGTMITSVRPITPPEVNLGQAKYPKVEELLEAMRKLASKVISFDVYELAARAGSLQSANMVILGALSATGKIPCDEELLKKTIAERWPRAKEVNLKAFELGRDEALKQLKGE